MMKAITVTALPGLEASLMPRVTIPNRQRPSELSPGICALIGRGREGYSDAVTPDPGGVNIHGNHGSSDGPGFFTCPDGAQGQEGGIGMVSDRVTAALARMNGDGGDGDEQRNARTHGRRISLSPSQVVGSSLAASCSAIVASFLGVAGTIGGAAIGSVVATTGTAVYGPALRHGGKRIVKRLGPNTIAVSEANPQTPTWTQTELALTPAPEAGAIAEAASDGPSQPPRKTRYRKPIAISVAMLAVFVAAIIVGLLAGGPVRQAGTGYNFTRPQPVTGQHSATASSGSTGSSATATSTSASSSATPTGTAPSTGSTATNQGSASQTPAG
jgi:hypothetical protein